MDNIVVRKANRIIRVTENELAKYLSTGYEVVKGDEAVPVKEQAPSYTTQAVEVKSEPIKVDTNIRKQRKRK